MRKSYFLNSKKIKENVALRGSREMDKTRDYQREADERYHIFFEWLKKQQYEKPEKENFYSVMVNKSILTKSTIQRLYTDESMDCSTFYPKIIADVYNVPIDTLFELTPDPTDKEAKRYELASYIANIKNEKEEEIYDYLMLLIDREIGYSRATADLIRASYLQSEAIKSEAAAKKEGRNIIGRKSTKEAYWDEWKDIPQRLNSLKKEKAILLQDVTETLKARKGFLAYKRIVNHIPRLRFVLGLALIYNVSLDMLFDTKFAFSDVADENIKFLLRKLYMIDDEACDFLVEAAVFEREGRVDYIDAQKDVAKVLQNKAKNDHIQDLLDHVNEFKKGSLLASLAPVENAELGD